MSITSRSLSSRIRPTVSLRWGAVAMAAFLATGCSVLEEDKIAAYFGAGLLYADRFRQEPLL